SAGAAERARRLAAPPEDVGRRAGARDDRGQLPPLVAELVQPRGVERRRRLEPVLPARPPREQLGERPAPAAAPGAPRPGRGRREHRLPEPLRLRAVPAQDRRRGAVVGAEEAEQDVLGADLLVAERDRLAERELEGLLRLRAEAHLPLGGAAPAGDGELDDAGPDALRAEARRAQDGPRGALALAQEPEQEVPGADVVVAEGPRLLLGEDDHLAGAAREAREHRGEGYSLAARPAAAASGRAAAVARSSRSRRRHVTESSLAFE